MSRVGALHNVENNQAEEVLQRTVAALVYDNQRAQYLNTTLNGFTNQINQVDGKIKFATTQQAQQGTDNTTIMTPRLVNSVAVPFNNTLVNNAELNNYTTIGKYAIGTSPLVGGVVNYGFANSALEVSTSADIIFQELKLLDGAIYQRVKVGGLPWSDIFQVYDGQTNFYDLKQSVSNGKALVAAAVTGKGVPTAADATFQTIATNVSQINTGINYRTGTVTSNSTLVDFRNIDNTNIVTAHQVTISNIGFLPRSVKLFTINSVDNNWDVVEYDLTVLNGAIRSYSLITGSPISLINSNYAPVVVNANSIVFPARLANTQYTYKIYGE